MSTANSRQKRAKGSGRASEHGTTGDAVKRISADTESQPSPTFETDVENSPLLGTTGEQIGVPTGGATPGAPPGDSEEIISVTAWRPGFGIRVALRHELATVDLPVVGPVTLPGLAHLAWYGGVAALVALEIVELPMAALIVIAKALADSRHHELLRSFGEAVESRV